MSTLTPEGRHLVQDLAQRHDFAKEAVLNVLEAMVAGNGRMAQFAHPELGGSGQWMSGGMLMIGNLSDQGLKGRVERLCSELSNALGSAGPSGASGQSQVQGGHGTAQASPFDTPFFEASKGASWWPWELGTPDASGSRDSMRYAYFAEACRLVVDMAGEMRLHDTLDHRIGGFSQQQGGNDGVSMSSQHGTVELGALPILDRRGEARSPMERAVDAARVAGSDASTGRGAGIAPASPAPRVEPAARAEAAGAPVERAPEDPLRTIERLGELRERGILTDEEFADKKRELLARL